MNWLVVEDKNIADLYIKVFGKDKINLLQNIIKAFSDQITNLNKLKPILKQKITIKENNLEKVIETLINKLIYFKDVKEELFNRGQFSFKNKTLQVTLFGQKIKKNLPLKVDIKALTYHRFKVEKNKQGYQVDLVFDI